MLTQRDASNALRTPTSWTQRDASGVLRTLKEIWMRDAGNVLRKVFAAGGGSGLTPLAVAGYGRSTAAIFITTDAAAVSGAPAGSTFVWNFADAGWTATSPASSTTPFRAQANDGETVTTTVSCTVTPPGASSYTTNTITASVTNFGRPI